MQSIEQITPRQSVSPQTSEQRGTCKLTDLIGDPQFLAKAGPALPLFLRILSLCAKHQQPNCDLTCKEISQELSVSSPTVTHWRRRLVAANLIDFRRQKGKIRFLLPDEFAKAISRPASGHKPQSATVAVLSMLMARIDDLENRADAAAGETV